MGISDFGEDIMSEAGSDSGGNSSHDGSRTTRTVNINFFILQPKRVVDILYSRDTKCKADNYHKVAGKFFFSVMSANATMFNEYSFPE